MRLNKTSNGLLITIIIFSILIALAKAEVTVQSVSLGSSTQDRNQTLVTTFTITNTGNETVEIVGLSSTALSKYNVAFSNVTLPYTLSPNNSTQVVLSLYVPLDHPAVDANGDQLPISIGSIVVSWHTLTNPNVTLTSSSDLKLQAKNRLQINKGNVLINSLFADPREKRIRENTRIENLKPGDKLNFKFEVENEYPVFTECDIRNAEVKLGFDSPDFDLDSEFETEDIDAGDEVEFNFRVDVDEEAKRGTTNAALVALGKDCFGALHGDRLAFRLEVERELHDLVVKSASVSQSELACGTNRKLDLTVKVWNIGRLDEDEVVVEGVITPLNLKAKTNTFALDEDDLKTVTLSFNIPDNAKPGNYSIKIFTYYDTNILNNVGFADFKILECVKEEVEEVEEVKVEAKPTVEEIKEPVVAPQPIVVTQPPAEAPTVKVQPQSFFESELYTAILLGAVIVLAVIIVILLVVLFRK